MRRAARLLAVAGSVAAWACSNEGINNVGKLRSSGSPSSGGNAPQGGSGGSGPVAGAAGQSGSSAQGGTGGGLVVPGRERCYGLPYGVVAGAGGGSAGASAACVGRDAAVEPVPLDLYVLMDRSSSMNEQVYSGGPTRWEMISSAVEQLVGTVDLQDTRVGMQFFSLGGGTNEAVECDPASYANPRVEIGPLSETGPQIAAAIEEMAQWLGGQTPTYAALRGGLQHAAAHVDATGRTTAVALVTDGLPTQCEEQDPAAVAELAAQALVESGVLTFAIGVAGQWNLQEIARAGGTHEAYIISEGEVVEQFVDTIRSISTTPLPCEFTIPDPPDITQEIDYDKVQVLFWPEDNGPAEEIPRVFKPEYCEGAPNGGWYYDSDANPTLIRVCPCNCNRFGLGRAEVRFGCEPRIFEPE